MSAGVAGVAAPIRSQRGLVVGAIGIAGAVDRFCDRHGRLRTELAVQVQDAARAVSRQLGSALHADQERRTVSET